MGRDTARTTQPDDAIDLRSRSAGRSTRRPDLCLMSPTPQRSTAAAALGLAPDPCSQDRLADYYRLRRALPADYAMLEEAARAGEPARVGLALHALLPGMLRWQPRESLLAELPGLVGPDGPAPGAATWAVRMAENEAFRRYLGDRMLDSVTVEWVPAEMRLRFVMAGVILDDPGDGTVDLVALDPVSSMPFAEVLLDEIAAAEQLVAIEDLARRAVLATDEALPIAIQLLTSPERYSLNDAEQFRKNVVAVADLAAPAIAQLHPSNQDQLARLMTAQTQLEVVRGITESGWRGIQTFQRAHSPDETAGELYDWAAEEQYQQGGAHYISGAAYDVWHFLGEVTTFGSMGRRADNARAYREGRISYDAYEENERWDLLASAVTAIITGLSLGLGARLAAGRFAISAGYTPVGSAVLSGTVAGGGGATADAMARDAAALLASHATDNPYVAAYQRSRIGGPAGWLQSGLVGAMAGGILGGLLGKIGIWSSRSRVQTRTPRTTRETSTPAQEPKGASAPPVEAPPVEAPPPTQAEIAAMYQMDTGPALRQAAEFARHPGTVFHHNIGKGGTRAILESNTMIGGEGTASFGGGTSVRAWFGEAPVTPATPRTSPTIEFTVPGPRPDVRLYAGGTPGLKWNVDTLTIHVRRVYLPDGRIAVPEGGGYFRVTASDGTTTQMHVSDFPP